MDKNTTVDGEVLERRRFLGGAAALTALTRSAWGQVIDRPVIIAHPGKKARHPGAKERGKPWLENAIQFGNLFTSWRSSYGAPDPLLCPYRTPGPIGPTQLHSPTFMARALYRLYEVTGTTAYKEAADGYATFHLNMVRDPEGPYDDEVVLYGKWRNLFSRAWIYGRAMGPCFEEFRKHNPHEDAFDTKAFMCYRCLQKYRRPDSYFGIGYAIGDHPDGQFSCDLGEVGNGLVGFYNIFEYKPALDDAIGLAGYFLRDWEAGSGRGVWSPKINMWLVGPWAESSGEHFTDQVQSEVAWGWSAFVDAEFLLRLRVHVQDETLRNSIDDHCVKAFRWCFDACRFPDGAHGMFGRDDKWVGMGAAALLIFCRLKSCGALPAEVENAYRPNVEASWKWMLTHTGRDTFPPDGYIQITGRTTKKPLENLAWLMAWTVEALIEGSAVFDRA